MRVRTHGFHQGRKWHTLVDVRTVSFLASLGALLLFARSSGLLAGVLFLGSLAGGSGSLGGGLLVGGLGGHFGGFKNEQDNLPRNFFEYG